MKQSLAAACLLVVAVSTFSATVLQAAKILLVPININSHVMYFSRLGIDLENFGHVTTLLAPCSARVPDFVVGNAGNFSYVKYPVDEEIPFVNSPDMSERLIAMAMNMNPLQYVLMLRTYRLNALRHMEQDCTRLLDNVELMRHVKMKGFDFAIMDPLFAVSCYYTIPLSLGIPYASLSVAFFAGDFRVPRLASFPSWITSYDPPTFLERLRIFLVERMDPVVSGDDTYFLKTYSPNHPYTGTTEILQHQSLWFFLEDLSINYPLPQMPNTVAVGDIMAREKERPLSGEIDQFVSKSKGGVVIAVFGSYCDFFPP